MTTKSNDQGRAYEYAWMCALYKELSKKRNTKIIINSSYNANERAWNSIDTGMQEMFKVSAEAAISTVEELEPKLLENKLEELTMKFQKDGEGEKGDVRDIVISRLKARWEVGLSIKHNHEAIKHSRLSHVLDFGKEWFDKRCSEQYWKDVNPIFDMLKKEKAKGRKWRDIEEKSTKVYVPLLNAFMDEVNRANETDSSIPQKMVEYLIGVKDYYKIVSRDDKCLTIIHTFNMHGTLNKKSAVKVSAIKVPIVELPDRIVKIEFKPGSDNTIEMYLNKGWQLSFRLHNASTMVEPSLKFDVQFVGMPITILTIECRWK